MDTVIVDSVPEGTMIDATTGFPPVDWRDGKHLGADDGRGLKLDAAAPAPAAQYRPVRIVVDGDAPFTRSAPSEAASNPAMWRRVLIAAETLD